MAKKILVLVADDAPDSVNTLSIILESAGYEVLTAPDGQAALEKAKTERPDLAIVDLKMPKIDGWRVCQQLRNDPRRPIPVIAVSGLIEQSSSGSNDPSDVADAYLPKPFEPDEVLSKIREVLLKVS